MIEHMHIRYARPAALGLVACCALQLAAQAPLNTLGTTLNINFFNTVPGVNNGLFGADSDMGSPAPFPGQLDLNAWDYFSDGTTAQAEGNASTFPGTLPTGNGYAEGGTFATGVNATDIDGSRCFGIQPTGGHFTSGNLTLRAVNNTGGPITRMDVSYLVHYFNDLERSNRFRFLYSVSNEAGSYVPVAASIVESPLEADAEPEWVSNPIAFSISGINVPDGGYVYLRWLGEDIAGSGQRDEFALGNISLTPLQATGPTLTASATGLPAFSQVMGTPSGTQSFTFNGSMLSAEVTLVVTAPYEISLTGTSGFVSSIELDPVGGSVPTTEVYVRLNSSVPGASSGSVTISSAGANTLTVNLSGNTTAGSLPTLFINELMASTQAVVADENGEFDDWIEIFNPNATDVNIAGWYLSDDPATPTKYRIPEASTVAVVPANGWLLIWADNQSAQGDLHTNFALSATNGESVLLVGPDGVTIVDEIDFGPQVENVSFGRQTDGGLPWVSFATPTPNASNSPTSVLELGAMAPLRGWPVPVTGDVLYLSEVVSATVHDAMGRQVAELSRAQQLPLSGMAPGTYVLRTNDGRVLRFMKQ